MKIYLAGVFGPVEPEIIDILRSIHWKTYLFSYAYQHPITRAADMGVTDIMIDSGAFTVESLGKKIDINEYADWAKEYRKSWPHTVRFFNLDVIGSQGASNTNQHTLERLGVDVIPVIQHGCDLDHLRAMLEEGKEIIAFGGLVPHAKHKRRLHGWLDRCYAIIVERYKATGVLQKTHLLGISSARTVIRYPLYSCDSSSWTSVFRYGNSPHVERVPRTNQASRDTGSMTVIKVALRQYMSELVTLQNKAESIWEARGVVWQD